MTRARVVIIVCEVLVVISFAAKVIVDLQTKDINDAINQKGIELTQFFGTIEPKLRDIQLQSQAYERVWEASSKYSDVYSEIQRYIANSSANISISFTGADVTVKGDDNVTELRTIEEKMKSSNKFSDVRLELSTEGAEVQGGVGQYIISAKILKLEQREALNPSGTTTGGTGNSGTGNTPAPPPQIFESEQ